MPLYEYACESCGGRFERLQKYSDPPVEICPSCGGPVRKLISSPAIQFKGSGWYVTDYAKPSRSAEGSDKSSSESGAASTEAGSGKSGADSSAGASTGKDAAPATKASPAAPASPTGTKPTKP